MADYVARDPGIVVVTNVVSSVVQVNVEQRVNRMVRLERIWRKRAQCIDEAGNKSLTSRCIYR